jgi:hypothetical protein
MEIRSASCPGVLTFRVENIEEVSGSEGKNISFFINSSTCNPNEIYPIHDITFLKGYKP